MDKVRRTATFVGTVDRDKGTKFIITEMDASSAEEWAIRAMGAAVKGGADVPDSIMAAGWGAVAFTGIRAIMAGPWDEVKPLLAEMMSCVTVVDADHPNGRMLMEPDIQEIQTRAQLRDEVFKLHANFSIIAALSSVIDALKVIEESTQDTPISPRSSE